jgi:hypothetical protein
MRFLRIVVFSLLTCILLSALSLSACGRRESPSTTGITPVSTAGDRLGCHATRAKGEQKCIVVLTNFPDVKRQYSEKMLSDRITNFLGPYFQAVSYDKLRLKVDVSKPIVLPKQVSQYKISPKNVEVDRSKIIALVTDAANAADSDVNFNN